MAKFVEENYDGNVAKFYPHIHQFMQDRETGSIQVVGSEVNGKFLFYNKGHVSVYGSRRYKNYFE